MGRRCGRRGKDGERGEREEKVVVFKQWSGMAWMAHAGAISSFLDKLLSHESTKCVGFIKAFLRGCMDLVLTSAFGGLVSCLVMKE